MMHDFALTATYVVLLDLPVTFSMDAVSAGRKLPYTWNPGHQARVGLLSRDNPAAGVRWFEVDPCWVFHTLNAYDDDDGRVVADLVRYDGAYDVSTLSGHGPRRWIGGSSTRPPGPSPSSALMTGPRNSPGSMTGPSPSRTATATAPSSAPSPRPPSPPAATSPTKRSPTPCSNTT